MTTDDAFRATLTAVLALLSLLLVNCSGGMPSTVSAARVQAQPAKTQEYLYVGNGGQSGSEFLVYRLDGTKPLREVTRAWGVYGMAIDPWGDVYTTDAMPSGGAITAYTPRGRSVLLTIYEDAANALAIDSSGNVYDAEPDDVVVFRPRSRKVLRVIGHPAIDGTAMAFDSKGNLYFAGVAGHGAVEVYAPGASQPFRHIRKGVHSPEAVVFDAAGNLYVANCVGCYNSREPELAGSVTEYAPGAETPMRTIKTGIDSPVALAVGSNGLLFVENHPFAKPGYITIYGPSSRKPLRTIDVPAEGLTVSPNGDLYVGQVGKPCCSIQVYDPTGSKLLRTITDGVTDPEEIEIGSQ